MAKRKYPSELNTRTVRVNIADWQLLLDISRRAGINVAEAFHKLITRPDEKDKPVAKRLDQIPVITARSTPVIAVRSTPAIVVNRNKAGVIVIKPRGGKVYV